MLQNFKNLNLLILTSRKLKRENWKKKNLKLQLEAKKNWKKSVTIRGKVTIRGGTIRG